jgi:peptidoglycan-N-acetylglucosamine deacetylase
MTNDKPIASLSLDADDQWAYLRTHGDAGWNQYPSYLPRFFPLAFDLLDELQLKLTFFIVGFDATRAENLPALAAITSKGHEVGNHSFWHECCLHLYSREQIEDDVGRAEEAITAVTGTMPTGFRGPGFSWSPALLDVLERRGYAYDASTFPTVLAPLARRYFLATATLTPEELARREALFGTFRDGFRSIRPYRWELGPKRTLLEIPVTTIPGIRVPFHLSYLIYLARYSRALMVAYINGAIQMCRVFRVEPSFLLHPLDLLGGDQVTGLAFFPGMDLPTRTKLDVSRYVLRTLARHFELVPMGTHAAHILAGGALGRRSAQRRDVESEQLAASG